MIIKKAQLTSGVCFAWLPKWTADGLVWLERVRYRYNDTEFGSYTYRRMQPVDWSWDTTEPSR